MPQEDLQHPELVRTRRQWKLGRALARVRRDFGRAGRSPTAPCETEIILVNGFIVLVVGLVSFLLVRTMLHGAATNGERLAAEAKRDVVGIAARLQVETLFTERWLAQTAAEPKNVDAMRGQLNQKAAIDLCDQLKGGGPKADFVALTSDKGIVLGRDHGTQMRDQDLAGPGEDAPLRGLAQAIATGHTGSELWHGDLDYVTSYVGVRDPATGKPLGAIVLGRTVSGTLAAVNEEMRETTAPLAMARLNSKSNNAETDLVKVGSAGGREDILYNAISVDGPVRNAIKAAENQPTSIQQDDAMITSAPLARLSAGGRTAILIFAAPATLIDTGSIAPSILGVMGLGIVLVIIGGWLLGNYISRPINTLEEGLLAILNGQADKRFELDHAELGGLAFRIDQLLNQLMGVEEDTTDAEGRVSKPPSAAHFSDAMSVDERRAGGEGTVDDDAAKALAAEPAAAYYARLYREYIVARKSIGEPTDHITEQAFSERIQSMEKDVAQRTGGPVRYQVETQGKEVKLLAIKLG